MGSIEFPRPLSHGNEGSVDLLADWFGRVNHAIEHSLQIREEMLETGEFRGVRDMVKAAEIT